jgi:hypothetical protein
VVATSGSPAASRLPVVARVAIVVATSVAAGVLTRIGEVTLPDAVQSAANSTAPWVLVTFVAVALSRLHGVVALATGAASFVAMDLAFYVTFGMTGGYYPHSYLLFWLIVAVVVGPLVALAAISMRREGWRGIAAAASVPSVFIGEAVFILARLPVVGRVYPALLVVAGIAILAIISRGGTRRTRTTVLTIGATLVGSAVFALGYNLVPLIIGKVVP